MKKFFLPGFLALMLCLSGCAAGKSAENETVPQMTAHEAATQQTQAAAPSSQPKSGYEDQLALFADCRGMWIRSDPKVYYYYAVTDLDQNGRLELIATACMGEDQTSVTEVWEINEAGTDLTCAAWGGDYASTADLIVNSAKGFCDTASDTYTYIFSDTMEGLGVEKRGCVLKDGTVTETLLCSQRAGKYYNAKGEEITREEYDQMEDAIYAGQGPLTAEFLWQAPFHDEIEVLSREDWYHMLEDSWQAFQLY